VAAITDVGEIEVICGVGLVIGLIVNTMGGCVDDGEVPPPGVGVLTEMSAVPGFSISDAGIVAFSWFVLTNCTKGIVTLPEEVVHVTDVCWTKLLPWTSSMNCGWFAEMLVGLIDFSVGAG
jgi:hypothetical protein